MKKRRLFLFVLVAVFCFTGCSSGTPESEEPAAVVTENPVAAETEAEPAKSEEPAEKIEEAEEEEAVDLLSALQPRQFDTLVVETEISGPEGFMSKSIVYQKGDNTRTEMEMPDGQKQIMILQAKEGVTYQYAEGTKQGMKIVHGDAETMMANAQEMESNLEIPDLRELENQMQENMVVRKEELNGEKAIYIEFNEINENVDNAVVKMWYSEEYAYPIRYEFFVNGELMMRSDVTKLEVDIDLDDALFMPPNDVEFMEINMEGGFEMPGMPENNE